MPLILAIHHDRRQSAQLAAVVRGLDVELVQAGSTTEGIRALGDRIPDLILTSPLLSPWDEGVLDAHLRDLGPAAAHVQTLRIPVLRSTTRRSSSEGVFSRLRGKRAGASLDGCDPKVFAEEIADYLARAEEEKAVQADRLAFRTPEPPAVQALVPTRDDQDEAIPAAQEWMDAGQETEPSYVSAAYESEPAENIDASPIVGEPHDPLPSLEDLTADETETSHSSSPFILDTSRTVGEASIWNEPISFWRDADPVAPASEPPPPPVDWHQASACDIDADLEIHPSHRSDNERPAIDQSDALAETVQDPADVIEHDIDLQPERAIEIDLTSAIDDVQEPALKDIVSLFHTPIDVAPVAPVIVEPVLEDFRMHETPAFHVDVVAVGEEVVLDDPDAFRLEPPPAFTELAAIDEARDGEETLVGQAALDMDPLPFDREPSVAANEPLVATVESEPAPPLVFRFVGEELPDDRTVVVSARANVYATPEPSPAAESPAVSSKQIPNMEPAPSIEAPVARTHTAAPTYPTAVPVERPRVIKAFKRILGMAAARGESRRARSTAPRHDGDAMQILNLREAASSKTTAPPDASVVAPSALPHIGPPDGGRHEETQRLAVEVVNATPAAEVVETTTAIDVVEATPSIDVLEATPSIEAVQATPKIEVVETEYVETEYVGAFRRPEVAEAPSVIEVAAAPELEAPKTVEPVIAPAPIPAKSSAAIESRAVSPEPRIPSPEPQPSLTMQAKAAHRSADREGGPTPSLDGELRPVNRVPAPEPARGPLGVEMLDEPHAIEFPSTPAEQTPAFMTYSTPEPDSKGLDLEAPSPESQPSLTTQAKAAHRSAEREGGPTPSFDGELRPVNRTPSPESTVEPIEEYQSALTNRLRQIASKLPPIVPPADPASAASAAREAAGVDEDDSNKPRLKAKTKAKAAPKAKAKKAAKKKAKTAADKPPQDEWGLFDPNQCGFAALLEKLEEETDDDKNKKVASVRIISVG